MSYRNYTRPAANGKPFSTNDQQTDLEYQLHMLRASAGINYFQFSRLFYLIFDGEAEHDESARKKRKELGNKRLDALFLQELIDGTQHAGAIREVVDGKLWFLCTVNYLANSISAWTDKEQDRRFYSLRRYGYVETMKRGKNPTRWIHINTRLIHRKIDAAKESSSPPFGGQGHPRTGVNGHPRTGVLTITNVTRTKRRGNAAANTPPVPPVPPLLNGHSRIPKTSPYHQSAVKLREALRRNNRVAAGALVNWPDHFRLLAEVDGQDYAAVLDWYCEHCGREDQKEFGLPSISSARQFRARYDWIEGKARRNGLDREEGIVTIDNGDGTTTTRIPGYGREVN